MDVKKAHKLKAVRRLLGMDQASFSKAIHYSIPAISGYENGIDSIPDALWSELCRLYHVRPEWIQDPDAGSALEEVFSILPLTCNGAEISARVLSLRKSLGMTQIEFSELTGVPRSTIAQIETNQSRLNQRTAEKIAIGCSVGVDWLLTGDESKKKYPVNERLINYLWAHPEEREALYRKMIKEGLTS